MGPASFFLKDPSGSRFVAGGLAELEALLGAPVPLLPPPERDGNREVFFVNVQPSSARCSGAIFMRLFSQIGVVAPDPRDRPRARADGVRGRPRPHPALRARVRPAPGASQPLLARPQQGRGGVSARARGQEARGPEGQVLAPPAALLDLPAAGPGRARTRERARPLARLARTRASSSRSSTTASRSPRWSSTELDFNPFLTDNKRYRLPADVFFEIHQVLVRETERRLREGDRGLLTRVARHLPGLPRDQYLSPQASSRS